MGDGLGDESATKSELHLCGCSLGGAACLGEVAKLTRLESSGAGLTQQGLEQLTVLKQLQRLNISKKGEVTNKVVKNVWSSQEWNVTKVAS
jgi:hypothetical protein